MLRKGVIPIPPATNTAGLAGFVCSVNDPVAGPILTSVPSGIFLSERLKAVSRKSLGVTQKELALTSGTGLRFVIDLEKGKETCEIEKAR